MPPESSVLRKNVLGVLLAGGQGSRLGQDKALVDLADFQSLESGFCRNDGNTASVPLGRAVLSALAACCRRLAVSVAHEGSATGSRWNLPARLGYPGAVLIEDRLAGCGPLAGLAAGLEEAAAATPPDEAVFVAACDYPLLPAEAVALLLDALDAAGTEVDAALPEIEGRLHPLCGAWSPRVLPRLAEYLASGERRAVEFAGRVATVRLTGADFLRAGLDPARSFLNVNTPDDLRRAARLLSEGSAAVAPSRIWRE
jgi:molybdopterin-guanine dinucleotide biosynthesis protein A